MFITVISKAGGVLYQGPVKGGVTSANKSLQSGERYERKGAVMKSPHLSGTYGSEDDYVYWFDPNGNLIILLQPHQFWLRNQFLITVTLIQNLRLNGFGHSELLRKAKKLIMI